MKLDRDEQLLMDVGDFDGGNCKQITKAITFSCPITANKGKLHEKLLNITE